MRAAPGMPRWQAAGVRPPTILPAQFSPVTPAAPTPSPPQLTDLFFRNMHLPHKHEDIGQSSGGEVGLGRSGREAAAAGSRGAEESTAASAAQRH